MSLVSNTIVWTIAVYAAYALLFADEIFDVDFGDAFGGSSGFFDKIADFFSGVFDLASAFVELVLLTKLATEVHPIFYSIVVLAVGLPWLVIILGKGA